MKIIIINYRIHEDTGVIKDNHNSKNNDGDNAKHQNNNNNDNDLYPSS